MCRCKTAAACTAVAWRCLRQGQTLCMRPCGGGWNMTGGRMSAARPPRSIRVGTKRPCPRERSPAKPPAGLRPDGSRSLAREGSPRHAPPSRLRREAPHPPAPSPTRGEGVTLPMLRCTSTGLRLRRHRGGPRTLHVAHPSPTHWRGGRLPVRTAPLCRPPRPPRPPREPQRDSPRRGMADKGRVPAPPAVPLRPLRLPLRPLRETLRNPPPHQHRPGAPAPRNETAEPAAA
jgi:hypothetical protein